MLGNPNARTEKEDRDNSAEIGGGVGGGLAGALLVFCGGGAVIYGKKKKPNKLQVCRYDPSTRTASWEPPREPPLLPTEKVKWYHIQILGDQLTEEEIASFRNSNVTDTTVQLEDQLTQEEKASFRNSNVTDTAVQLSNDEGWMLVATVKASLTSHQIDGLTANKKYDFRIYAQNKNGLSAPAYNNTGGNADNGNSFCGRNNSILPICAGGDQHSPDGTRQQLSQRLQHREDRHPPDEPKSNTTKKRKKKRRIRDLKTDEAGSFVSGKDVKVETGGLRAQPPLPGIKSGNRNTRGLSANNDDPEMIPEKKRLTPIGQESQLEWEEKRDRSEDAKEKKKKKKSKDKEKNLDVIESEKL